MKTGIMRRCALTFLLLAPCSGVTPAAAQTPAQVAHAGEGGRLLWLIDEIARQERAKRRTTGVVGSGVALAQFGLSAYAFAYQPDDLRGSAIAQSVAGASTLLGGVVRSLLFPSPAERLRASPAYRRLAHAPDSPVAREALETAWAVAAAEAKRRRRFYWLNTGVGAALIGVAAYNLVHDAGRSDYLLGSGLLIGGVGSLGMGIAGLTLDSATEQGWTAYSITTGRAASAIDISMMLGPGQLGISGRF